MLQPACLMCFLHTRSRPRMVDLLSFPSRPRRGLRHEDSRSVRPSVVACPRGKFQARMLALRTWLSGGERLPACQSGPPAWPPPWHTGPRRSHGEGGGFETMALPKHVDDAADRLHEAFARIEAARAAPTSTESLREWLTALTDYAQALMDLHEFTNESVHEKLH